MSSLQVMMSVGLLLFLALMAYLGWLGYRRTQTVADFAIAGAAMGPVTLGLAFAATFFSAATFVGYTGWAYGWGLSSLWIVLTLIIASPLGLIVVAKRVRNINTGQGSLSLPDWLGDRYGSSFLRVVVALATLFNLFYIAAHFSAGGLSFQQLLGPPYLVGLVAIAVIVTLYTVGGGSFADIYTDAAQALLMALTGLLVLVSGFWVFDKGFTGIMREVTATLEAQDPSMVAVVNPDSAVFYSVPPIVGAFIIQFAFSSQPHLFNKVLALRDPADMAKMILTYVLCAIAFLSVVFGGLYAAVVVPGLESADAAIMEYAQVAFPTILVALLGVTVLAAAMSTSDGIFVVISTSIANDIYRKFLVPRGLMGKNVPEEEIDRRTLSISRWLTALTGVAATLLVIRPPDFIGTFIWIGISGVASATLGPILVALFLPRLASARAASISAVAGLVGYLVIHFIGFEKSTLAAGAWAVLVGLAAMVVAGLVFREDAKTLARANASN
ncbi:MAG: sodium:solute symporter family protein [Ornithinimicrobium sp.]|uniref:sodium:solute symporter family protein n=1 Tax=Ornithinimicrobium sp. TaxID=1977084 RepID=UPI003D9B86B8